MHPELATACSFSSYRLALAQKEDDALEIDTFIGGLGVGEQVDLFSWKSGSFIHLGFLIISCLAS